jgi:hypothetical protein
MNSFITYSGNLHGEHAPDSKDIDITLKTLHNIYLTLDRPLNNFKLLNKLTKEE